MMGPEPRTEHGPRYPEKDCAGSAEELFGMSEEDVEAMAEEDTDTGENLFDDRDIDD